jgi:hypothetical protein
VPFVLTTTNAARVKAITGAKHPLHEIVGKPYDLKEWCAGSNAPLATNRILPIFS